MDLMLVIMFLVVCTCAMQHSTLLNNVQIQEAPCCVIAIM